SQSARAVAAVADRMARAPAPREPSVEERARDEADRRHRPVQQVGEDVEQNAAYCDVAPEALEQVGAVPQTLDHRIELILRRDLVHGAAHNPGRTHLTSGAWKNSLQQLGGSM